MRFESRRESWQYHKVLTNSSTVAMSDTHVFLLNEYFVELNTANYNILNKFLN